MEAQSNDFHSIWMDAMLIGAVISFIAAILIFIYHKIRVAGIKDPKRKYDYLSTKEIKFYQASIVAIAIGIGMLINTYGKDVQTFDLVWFFVLIFISIAGATLVGYIGALVLKYYYPTPLNNKLKKLRYTPRVNPKTGNKMRLLSEAEEDVHLDEGMQAEEEVFSVDYDVWIDDATQDTKIEKYQGHLQALQCNNCGFYTMRVIREEIVSPPTESEDGELIKHYKCQFCSSTRATSFHIAHSDDVDITKFSKKEEVAAGISNVVKIEIMTGDGKHHYEFQTTEQAKKFLDELERGSDLS